MPPTHALTPVPDPSSSRGIVVVRPPQSSPTAPPRRPLRHRLRGRGGWIVLAAILGAAGGTVLAYALLAPPYRATAVLAIEPTRLAAVPETRLDAITQRLLDTLRSPATLEQARPIDRHRLILSTDPVAMRQVRVSYVDLDPAAATGAAGRMIDAAIAASDLHTHETVTRELATRRAKLDEDRARLAELRTLHRQAQEAFGMLPLDQRIADRRRELDRLGVQLRELDLALAAANSAEAQAAPAPPTKPATRWGAAVRQVMDAMPRIERHYAVADLDGDPTPPMTLAELEVRRSGLASMQGVVSAELGDLIAKSATMNTLSRKVAEAEAALAEDELQWTSRADADAAVARLWVLDRGETAALDDPRTYVLQLAGAGLGGALLLAGIVTMGLASDRRLRRSDMVQTAPDDPPLLGAVPALTHAGSDDQIDLLSRAVHEVRSILEIHADRHGSKVFALTSPSRGAGKTSLTVGLGTSLALSGTRTLLIDLDLVQRGAAGDKTHQTIEQVMRDMGYADAGGASGPGLVKRDDRRGLGLAGLMAGEALGRCVMATKAPRLDVLHAHGVEPEQIGRISNRFVASLVRAARQAYDMVLIDAGTVPGRMEAMLAAARAEGVIIVVPRDQSQRGYDRTLAQLRLAQAKVIGTVFNRAVGPDAVALAPPGVNVRPPRRTGRRPEPANGSGILAAAVEARAGSAAFDRDTPIVARDVLPAADLPAAPSMDDTDEWETELEASLDRLVDEVAPKPQA